MAEYTLFTRADLMLEAEPPQVIVQWAIDLDYANAQPHAVRVRASNGLAYAAIAIEDASDETITYELALIASEPTVPGPGRVTIIGDTGLVDVNEGLPAQPVVGRFCVVHIREIAVNEAGTVATVTWDQAATENEIAEGIQIRLADGTAVEALSITSGDATATWVMPLTPAAAAPPEPSTWASVAGMATDAAENVNVAQEGRLTP